MAASLEHRLPVSPTAVRERCYASAYQALATGDLVNAQRLFAILALLSVSDERAWIGLAVVCERREQWQVAAGLYQVGAVFTSGSAWCLFGSGRALKQLGQNAAAERAFDAAEAAAHDELVIRAIEQERAEL